MLDLTATNYERVLKWVRYVTRPYRSFFNHAHKVSHEDVAHDFIADMADGKVKAFDPERGNEDQYLRHTLRFYVLHRLREPARNLPLSEMREEAVYDRDDFSRADSRDLIHQVISDAQTKLDDATCEIVMRRLSGETFDVIGTAMGATKGAMATRYWRAMTELTKGVEI